jgi:hypothetical protein
MASATIPISTSTTDVTMPHGTTIQVHTQSKVLSDVANFIPIKNQQFYYHFMSGCRLPADRQTNVAESPAENFVPTSHIKPRQAAVAEKNLIILSNLNNKFKDAMSALSTKDE